MREERVFALAVSEDKRKEKVNEIEKVNEVGDWCFVCKYGGKLFFFVITRFVERFTTLYVWERKTQF